MYGIFTAVCVVISNIGSEMMIDINYSCLISGRSKGKWIILP